LVRIAIVEDDPQISELLRLILSDITHEIEIINNGWHAIDKIQSSQYQLIILDVMLPGVNGLEICRKLRNLGNKTPVLMLTSKSEIEDKVAGLEIGADDYVTKPFDNKELLARAKALLRRFDKLVSQTTKSEASIQIKDIIIDPIARTVVKSQKELDITAKEFDLLYLFMENAGRSFTRSELLEKVWGENFEGLEHTVNSTINRIRMKIEDNLASPEYIMTVWGIGYKFSKN
jgi:two-component system, OmpR family, alkaline phosphatase synthesis response regulator PhoP